MIDEIKNAASQEQQTPVEGQIGGCQASESQEKLTEKAVSEPEPATSIVPEADVAAEAVDRSKAVIDLAEKVVGSFVPDKSEAAVEVKAEEESADENKAEEEKEKKDEENEAEVKAAGKPEEKAGEKPASSISEDVEEIIDYGSKSLKELVDIFQELVDSGNQQQLYKHAEMIKAAFYKVLKREKIASGNVMAMEKAAPVQESAPAAEEAKAREAESVAAPAPATEEAPVTEEAPAKEEAPAAEAAPDQEAAPAPKAVEPEAGTPVGTSAVKPESSENETVVSTNPFAEVERGFKTLYQQYKGLRAAYLAESEKHKEENLVQKEALIERLKDLVEKRDDVNRSFPVFRELQAEWRSIGPVPPAKYESINDTYQLYVGQFYDFVRINRELRDLDFKKNLDAKTALCEQAEALAGDNNVVDAFRKLQELHREWKELGPVDKENREVIWDRFRAATAVINKKHQSYFDSMKDQQKENLEKKTALCEKVEAIAAGEIKEASQWNQLSNQIEEVQKEWKKIGFASRKENESIYERFRAACDKFFNAKRDYYGEFKSEMDGNYEKKADLCAKAEAMKDSTDWKKTSEDLIELQKQWKEVGPVARKYSEQVWKRFRAACDAFFDERDKHFGSQDKEYAANLEAKKALIEKVKAFEIGDDASAAAESLKEIQQEWNSVGFVPFKDKEKVQRDFKQAMDEKFDAIRGAGGDDSQIKKYNSRYSGGRDQRFSSRGTGYQPHSERDRLFQKYQKEQQEIQTYENNMGFFSKSKNADAILADLNKKIDEAKAELANIEQQIKDLDAAESSKNASGSDNGASKAPEKN